MPAVSCAALSCGGVWGGHRLVSLRPRQMSRGWRRPEGRTGSSARKGGSCSRPFSSGLKEGEESGPSWQKASPHLEPPRADAAWKPGQRDPCSWRQGSCPALSASLNAPQQGPVLVPSSYKPEPPVDCGHYLGHECSDLILQPRATRATDLHIWMPAGHPQAAPDAPLTP